MNRKPDTAPRFAVNRDDMVSRLPGVKLPASSKRFARGKPKLASVDSVFAPTALHDSTFPLPLGLRRVR